METWRTDVKDWELIPLKTYEFLMERAKENFEETISECESITAKSISLFKAITLSIPFFIGINFKTYGLTFLVFFSVGYLINAYLLFVLMFPKSIIYRGTPPKATFNHSVAENGGSDELEGEEKTTIIYYHELHRIQNGIDFNNKSNNSRILLYKISMAISFLIFSTGIILGLISPPW